MRSFSFTPEVVMSEKSGEKYVAAAPATPQLFFPSGLQATLLNLLLSVPLKENRHHCTVINILTLLSQITLAQAAMNSYSYL